ncbi:MAG: M42 family peptidase, partial [Planctomycetota bacterium]|nr:M42 family peptidase [Planctomycetota bacterium]
MVDRLNEKGNSMDEGAKKFLQDLLETPGVSGYEERVQSVVEDYARNFADSIEKDLHGNLILAKNKNSDLRVMFAGHCDQIGLIVSQIDEHGFIYFQTVGGWDAQQLIGQRVSVWTQSGEIPGVIARKAIHLQDESERKQVSKAKDLWVDIGASDKDDARSIVSIGDPITLRLGFQELRNGLANAPAMDDRTGLWVCVEAMRRSGAGLDCGLFVASTVQEEIG